MLQRIYIETTIPSFYYEARITPDMLARRDWTVEWWQNQRNKYHLVTSAPVIEELNRGNHPQKSHCIDLISTLSILTVEKEIYEIVEFYIEMKLMPNDPRGDAIHLALASFHNCQFLFNVELRTPGQCQ